MKKILMKLTDILLRHVNNYEPIYSVDKKIKTLMLFDGKWEFVGDGCAHPFIKVLDECRICVSLQAKQITDQDIINLFKSIDDIPDWECTYDRKLHAKELVLPIETKHTFYIPYPEYLGVIVETMNKPTLYGTFVYLNSIRREIKNE